MIRSVYFFKYWTYLLLAFLFIIQACSPPTPKKQPNIIFIVADDLGIGRFKMAMENLTNEHFIPEMFDRDFSKYDMHKAEADAIKSITMLRTMAKEGVYFNNAFVPSSWCSPSRLSILTGRYPQRDKVWISNDVMVGAVTEEMSFLPEFFQDNGYKTGIIGKWHLGTGKGRGGMKPFQHPNKKGFDYYFGFDYSGTTYYHSNILYRDTTPAKPVGFLTDDFTEEAIGFIKKNKEERFFLYLPYNAPHGPLHLAPKGYFRHFDKTNSYNKNDVRNRIITDTLGPSDINNYNSHIFAMDFGITRIKMTLEELGLDDNTIIVFTSDHGAPGWASIPLPANSPYKGYKGQIHDGSFRVPLIVWGPGIFSNKGICEEMVMSFDILPTLLSMAGISIPSSHKVDGKDLSNYLFEDLNNSSPVHDHLVWAGMNSYNQGFYPFYSEMAVRNIPPRATSSWMVKDKDFTLKFNTLTGLQLFSNHDYLEIRDYKQEYPNETKELYQKYKYWFDENAEKPLTFPHTWDDTHYIHHEQDIAEI